MTRDGEAVWRRLGLGDDERSWVSGLEADGPPVLVTLPAGAELAALLRRLGFAEPDVAGVMAAVPDRARDAELWWLLERCASRLIRAVGDWEAHTGPWPELPAALGACGRCFWVFVHVAAVPAIRPWHRARGVPDDVSWATLADLGRHVGHYRRRRGASGLGADSLHWMGLHFRGALYALGRLQFNMYHLRTGPGGPLFWYGDGGGAEVAADPGLETGAPILGTHIPEAGPLTPAECAASVRWAGRFFAESFPEHGARIAVCTSWLLDDQLAEYLPATSNIVRFQRMFTLVPGAWDTNDDIVQFVFHRPASALDEVRPRTTLERAIVAHIRARRIWRLRTGWLPLPR